MKLKNKTINRALTAAVLLALQPAAWAESEMPAEPNLVQEQETESATDVVQADTGSMVETPPETEQKTGWWQTVKDNVRETWRSEHSELYIPLRTWHNRAIYSREKIKTFNEAPWGIGWGKVRDTPHNTTHSLGLMVFADSHNDPEPFLAYSWQRNWSVSENQKVSLGAFAGFTARSDYNYVPIPVAWPYVSYSYKNLSIQGMYFPGSKGNGNIAFFWAKYRF